MSLQDGLGRRIEYLRLSVTDRCDFRCVYCMAEDMTFLPRAQILTLEEIERLARLFVSLGVRKIRLTGGEPLVRRGIVDLCARISALPGLRELVMTSNASQLVKLAEPLAALPPEIARFPVELEAGGASLCYRGGDGTGKGKAEVAELTKALIAAGIDYTGIETRESSLEDIFVSLLGEGEVAA